MATFESLIRGKEAKISSLVDNFTDGIPAIEREIIEGLLDYVAGLNVKAGRLDPESFSLKLIAQVEKEIFDIIRDAGYYDNVNAFLSDFDEIDKFNKNIHKTLNDIAIGKLNLNPYKAWARDNALYHLQEGRALRQLVEPVREALTRNIITGGSLKSLRSEIRDIGTGELSRYSTQVARDTLKAYDGVIQEKIRVEFEFDAIRYVGSLIEDSRPQCKRWVGMNEILHENLGNELQWAYGNGAGMIPGTNVDNFMVYLGGYNCRHQGIPVRAK